MKSPEAIEAALARLMPAALSEQGQRALDATIEQLAAGQARPAACRKHPAWKIAAVAAVVIGGTFGLWPAPAGPAVHQIAAATRADGFETLTSSERIETIADEGLVQDDSGAALRATRVRIVGQNQFRDRGTGEVVSVTMPREEVVYLPVSSF